MGKNKKILNSWFAVLHLLLVFRLGLLVGGVDMQILEVPDEINMDTENTCL